jgi:hypothetical protein
MYGTICTVAAIYRKPKNKMPVDGSRKCKVCGVGLTVENMYRSMVEKFGYKCKPCTNVQSKRWARNNQDKVKSYRVKSRIRRKYGISPDQYEALLHSQNGVCAICQREHKRRRLNIDHCHKTGAVRGLLCDRCNLAIGLLRDQREVIARVLEYLS